MSRVLKDVLNEGNPNKIPEAAKAVQLGQALTGICRAKIVVAGDVGVLPDEAKAAVLLGGFRTVGAATGPITPVTAAPALAGEVQVNLDGDLAFLAADAVTEAEVWYVGFDGRVIEETLPVVGNIARPSAPAQLLISVDQPVGGAIAAKNARGTAQAADTDVQLSADGDTIVFGTASTVTQARVKYLALETTVTDRLVGSVDF